MLRKIGVLVLLAAIYLSTHSAIAGAGDSDSQPTNPSESCRHTWIRNKGIEKWFLGTALLGTLFATAETYGYVSRQLHFPPSTKQPFGEKAIEGRRYLSMTNEELTSTRSKVLHDSHASYGRIWENIKPDNGFEIFYQDQLQQTLAVGTGQYLPRGYSMEIVDPRTNAPIGWIVEDLSVEAQGQVLAHYQILNEAKSSVAHSIPVALGTQGSTGALQFQNSLDENFLSFRWGKLNFMFRTSWQTELRGTTSIDPRLIVLLPAFKSAVDSRR